jgi:hypothetical protein
MARMSKTAAKSAAKKTARAKKLAAKGKTKRAKRVAARSAKIRRTGKTGAGRAIVKGKNAANKIKKKVDKIKGSKLGRIAKAGYDVYKNVKSGKISGAAKAVGNVAKAVAAKRSYPKKKVVKKTPARRLRKNS